MGECRGCHSENNKSYLSTTKIQLGSITLVILTLENKIWGSIWMSLIPSWAHQQISLLNSEASKISHNICYYQHLSFPHTWTCLSATEEKAWDAYNNDYEWSRKAETCLQQPWKQGLRSSLTQYRNLRRGTNIQNKMWPHHRKLQKLVS